MTKFAEMPEGSRRGWVAWAQSHDWGRNANYHDGEIYGCEDWYSYDQGGTTVHVMDGWRAFSTPADMKAWAGY